MVILILILFLHYLRNMNLGKRASLIERKKRKRKIKNGKTNKIIPS